MSDTPNGLTPAQVRVAVLAAMGLSNRDIAETTNLSLSTVKNHKNAIYKRSAAVNLDELRLAQRLGVLGDPHGLDRTQYRRGTNRP